MQAGKKRTHRSRERSEDENRERNKKTCWWRARLVMLSNKCYFCSRCCTSECRTCVSVSIQFLYLDLPQFFFSIVVVVPVVVVVNVAIPRSRHFACAFLYTLSCRFNRLHIGIELLPTALVYLHSKSPSIALGDGSVCVCVCVLFTRDTSLVDSNSSVDRKHQHKRCKH